MSDPSAIGLEQEETTVSKRFPDSYRQYKARLNTDELTATVEAITARKHPRTEIHLESLLNCSTQAYFVRNDETGEVRVHSNRCRQRWCPICAQTLANWRTMSLLDYTKKLDRPKFVTLTLKHSPAPLRHQIDSLYNSFKSLRKCKLLKKHILGGVWFFQVKQSKTDGLWHPHLHIVADSNYLPKDELSRAWLRITHTSKIVDVRLIKKPKQTAKYVARYSARPANLAELSLCRRLELIEAMAGRRLCGTWGTARQVQLKPPQSDDVGKWINIGNWQLVINCLSTSQIARTIVEAWTRNATVSEDCTLSDIEKLLDHPQFEDEPETYSDTTTNERDPPWQQSTLGDFVELYATPRSALANSSRKIRAIL